MPVNKSSGRTKNKFQNSNYSFRLKFDYAVVGLIIITLFILFVRIRLLNFPLERDEGGYAYIARMILKGFPPYTMGYNMKLPGTWFMYALFLALFGNSGIAIHLGLMIINIMTFVLIFFIVSGLLNSTGGFIAATTYAILSTSGSLFGQAAHVTHFVTFFGVAGIYFLLKSLENGKWHSYFVTGILMSLSVLMKQSFLFPLFAIVLLLYKVFIKQDIYKTLKGFLIFCTGFALPLLLTVSVFLFYGNFDRFWFWTFTYAREYGTMEPISNLYGNLSFQIPRITKDFGIIWILFIAGLPFIFINKNTGEKKWSLGFFVFLSILSVFPGYYFRSHYFITLLPGLSIVIAVLFDYLSDILHKTVEKFKYRHVLIFLLIISYCIGSHKDFFFKKTTDRLCLETYYGNPFIESSAIAAYIKANTSENDKILVLGSEPQIYFYSGRESVTPYIYMYDLMNANDYATIMQKELIKNAEKLKPKIIVFVKIGYSWLHTDKSNSLIFNWTYDYIKKERYKLSGIIDNAGLFGSACYWNNDALNYRLPGESKNYILVYKKD